MTLEDHDGAPPAMLALLRQRSWPLSQTHAQHEAHQHGAFALCGR